ncbi:MAG: DinB family protein [Chloroflexota bacterium]
MISESTLNQMRESLRQSQGELVQMLDRVDEATLHQPHGEENWSLAVMLAHLTEARPYFARQAETLITTPGTIVGRTLDNEQRVEAIIDAQRFQLSRDQLKQQLLDSHTVIMRLLASLSEAQLQMACTHARLGATTLGDFIRGSIVDHDQAHVQQAKTFLQTGSSAQ